MQKPTKFLISDLISDQATLYAPRQIINEHDSSSRFLSVQNHHTEYLVKEIDINRTSQANINEIIYTQLNEFFTKSKPNHNGSSHYSEANTSLNEFSQTQHNETHLHNSFCNCITCQALRFFNLVNQDLNASEKSPTIKVSTSSTSSSSSNNFININQNSHTNNNSNNCHSQGLEERFMVNLSNTEPTNIKKRSKIDEAYKKTSQTLNEPKVLKNSMSKILKGNFLRLFSIPRVREGFKISYGIKVMTHKKNFITHSPKFITHIPL
jgi:hypothetical protein